MTISTKTLIDTINSCVASSTTPPLELMQLAEASAILENAVVTVATLADLPLASANTGRMIWVEEIGDYRYSDGYEWGRTYNSGFTSDASVWMWGQGSNGNLGNNSSITKASPVSVVGGITNWCQLSVGGYNSSAIKSDGTLWAWGWNLRGQLGDNSTVNKSSPVSVVGGFTDWCQVSIGYQHVAAVRTNGTLWSWGCGWSGRLGDNTVVDKSSPVSVVGGFTDWCRVESGIRHTAAVRTNGTLWTWGYNGDGELGDGTTVDKSSPVSVVGGFTDWCQVSAGTYHTLALRANGTLWSWGGNSKGQLGDNTTVSKSSPVSVVGGFTDWCHATTGYLHTVAIRSNGTIWAWGGNNSRQLGDGTNASKSSPVSVIGGFTDWCQVATGYCHSVALRLDGTIWAWGQNGLGEIGDATFVNKSSPVSVVGGFNDWCQVSANKYASGGIRYRYRGF